MRRNLQQLLSEEQKVIQSQMPSITSQVCKPQRDFFFGVTKQQSRSNRVVEPDQEESIDPNRF